MTEILEKKKMFVELYLGLFHDKPHDVTIWKRFPRYGPFGGESIDGKGKWCKDFIFPLLLPWTNLRRHITLMWRYRNWCGELLALCKICDSLRYGTSWSIYNITEISFFGNSSWNFFIGWHVWQTREILIMVTWRVKCVLSEVLQSLYSAVSLSRRRFL